MRIIDFHAHAFPDEIAERAMPVLQEEGGIDAVLDGTIGSLLRSMDAAGIAKAVVASIATKPKQFPSILQWSQSIASDRLVPFPSVHPADPEAAERVRMVKEAGLKGIKLHPYYQDFSLDEERVQPIYAALQDCGLILLCHTGFDFAYERKRICDPARIWQVVEAYPHLKLVTSHLGAWEDWDEVEKRLLGKPIYMELSFTFDWIGPERAKRFLETHPREYLLFGTDSPWADQGKTLAQVRALGLDDGLEAAVLYENAERLLGLV